MNEEEGKAFEAPPVPDGLGLRGAEFWVECQADLAFDSRETELLTEVCRTLDTIDSLAAAIAADGVMIQGSQGQQVLNSAVAELRQQQIAYSRLVLQLNLDGAEGDEGMKSSRAASASEAAKRRWGTQHA